MTDVTDETITVSLGWSETVQYNSLIILEVATVRAWMIETAGRGGQTAASLAPITDEDINEYLRDVDQSIWFEQCDTATDFVSVSGRDIDHQGAEIVVLEEPREDNA